MQFNPLIQPVMPTVICRTQNAFVKVFIYLRSSEWPYLLSIFMNQNFHNIVRIRHCLKSAYYK